MRTLAAVLLVGMFTWMNWPATAAADEDWLIAPNTCAEAGLKAYWQVELPLLDTENVDEISAQDRQIYVTTTGGAIMAVSADTGIVRWMHKLVEPGSKVFVPQNIGDDPQDGFVLVTTVTTVYIMDQLDGTIMAEIPLRLPPSGAAATNGSRIYVGGNNGWLHSIPLNDGNLERRMWANLYDRSIRWPYLFARSAADIIASSTDAPTGIRSRVPRTSSFSSRFEKGVWADNWSVRFDEIVPSPPVMMGDRFYVTVGEQLYCIGAENKANLWNRPIGGPPIKTLAATSAGVFVASSDGSVRSFNLDDGKLQWRFRTGSPCLGTPVVSADTVYVQTERGLYAIDAVEGTARWSVADGYQLLSRDGNMAYVLTNCSVRVINNDTGEIERRLPIRSGLMTTTTERSKAVYLATFDGRLVCLMPDEVPYLRAEAVKKEMRKPSDDDAALAAELKRLTTPPQQPLEEPNPLESEASRRARAASGANN